MVVMTNYLTTIEEIRSGVEATLMMTSTKVFKTSVTQSSQLKEAFLELTSARQSDYTRKLSDLRLFYVLTTWYLCRYKLASYMIENVTKRGYHKPTPIQMQAVPLMIHVSAS